MNSGAAGINDAKSIFGKAQEFDAPADRAAYLDEACSGDAGLRAEVEGLLLAADQAGGFMDGPAVATIHTAAYQQPVAEGPGTVIGPYKLLQQIGEGGMGVVFMAEQTEPLQRTVALKIIKPGMDTRQVVARFEAERQALALMDHPNIARVLDAGTTGAGGWGLGAGEENKSALAPVPSPQSLAPRPFFVMELVKGVPITRYCDDKHLPLRDRLELFVQVCQAVQHAHQKGIIHRDIKPNNVLVAEYDNHAVPKVIDFGVAKATAQRLTERTMFTEFGQVLGTLEYMSPEQAKLNQLDIDTRSDIYSLGVLLYELLAGSTPFDRQRLHSAAFDEMLRIIREEEPPKPSTRLSSLTSRERAIDSLPLAGRVGEGAENSLSLAERAGERGTSLASIAANRHTEPARLSKDVQGELDWIVMKALEKDRNRRYETASGFAADIERHLHDEPVAAGPPSAAYRFRKFARRNRTKLATGALLALAILVALGGIASGVWERTARQARVTGQLEVILDEVARLEKAEKWSEALVSARRAEPALAAGEAPPEIQERVRQALVDLELVQRLDEIRAQSGTVWVTAPTNPIVVQADQEYASAFRQAGIDLDALPVSEAIQRITARGAIAAALLPALDDWLAVRSVIKSGEVRSMDKDDAATRRLIDVLHAADPDPWRQRVREAMVRKDQSALANLVTAQDLDRQPAATLTALYAALWASGKQREQELVLRRAQRKNPADYWINVRLGVDLIWRRTPDDVRDGIGFMRAAAALRPQSSHPIMILGVGYSNLGQYDQAIDCFRRAIELSPTYSSAYSGVGGALAHLDRHEEAIAAYEQAIQLSSNDPPLTASLYGNLAMLLSTCPEVRLRNPRRAAELSDKAVEIAPEYGNCWTALGVARYRDGRWDDARKALEKSLQLSTGGWGGGHRWDDAIDWFFLAMCHWQMEQQKEARQCYDRAVREIEGKTWQTEDWHLGHIRVEAEELLKITDQKPTTKPPVEVK